MTVFKVVKTPCVGVCSTGIGDSVCRGCKRFAHEVIDWNAYTQEQRQLIVDRLEQFLVQVVQLRFEILDERRLLAQIEHQQIRFNREQNPYCWVFDLLRAGASQIDQLDTFGLRLKPNWLDRSLPELREQIDHNFYELSCAHYERFIEPGMVQETLAREGFLSQQ